METTVLILGILSAFTAMATNRVKQGVAMPLLALFALAMAGREALQAAQEGAANFILIAVIFTAVAVPAHLLHKSRALQWGATIAGELLGTIVGRLHVPVIVIVPFACLFMTYGLAALFHNTTSILVSAGMVYLICKSYGLPPLPVLCGSLVASNAGGFSTRWGDTPNLTEAMVWNLHHSDFFREILPVNIGLMVFLSLVVTLRLRRRKSEMGRFEIALGSAKFRSERRALVVDRRMTLIGLIGLGAAVLVPMFYPEYELTVCGIVILFCCLANRPERREETLMALGLDTYATLLSVFILARVLAHSSIGIGNILSAWLQASKMSIWGIATTSYVGTLLTEAASWASAVSGLVHTSAPTHASAWALGAGICAGSSSLVTAASAGIILVNETKSFGDEGSVTFGSYIKFGLLFSALQLLYYVIVLSIIWR